jgi:hypothetical protein
MIVVRSVIFAELFYDRKNELHFDECKILAMFLRCLTLMTRHHAGNCLPVDVT